MGFKPRQRRVTVYWIDPYIHHGWHKDDEEKPFAISCASTGWLLRQNAKQVEIALSVSQEGDVADVQVIPRSAVIRIERL